MKGFAKRRRRKLIQKMVLKVGPLLQQRYGHSETYTIGQVTRTMEDAKIREDLFACCFAIFLSQEDFEKVHREHGRKADYIAVRREISELCFSGEGNFTVRQAIRYSASSGDVGFGDSGGGFGGGDGGGGGCGGGD